MQTSESGEANTVGLVAGIVAAYVQNNNVARDELAALIATVRDAVTNMGAAKQEPVKVDPLVPAVSIKKSVTDDFIICLEDGKKFKSLKRHLMTHYNMSPMEYRAKWGLPADYPMVAPSYTAKRSALAKTMGLGRKKAEEPAPAPKRRATRKAKEAA